MKDCRLCPCHESILLTCGGVFAMAQDLLVQDSPSSFVVHQPSEFMFPVV